MKARAEAGNLLAAQLAGYANEAGLVVLAMPRSGVWLGATVATKLNAPLDIFLVRELGRPNQPTLPMGVIATGGVCRLDSNLINFLGIDERAVQEVVARERQELARQEARYRKGHRAAEVRERTVILVTDSITTGGTAEAAIAALRQLRAKHIVIAAATIARPEYNRLRAFADGVVAVMVPEEFYGVPQWHRDFSHTTDEKVYRLLAETNGWMTEAAA